MSGRVFEYRGKPIAKPRMTRSDQWKKRPATTAYWAFKDDIRLQSYSQKFHLGESFQVTFFMPMPKSWSKKKKDEMAMKPHQQKPDVDNLLKAVMDCLLPEDSAVHDVAMRKLWVPEENAGIIIINQE